MNCLLFLQNGTDVRIVRRFTGVFHGNVRPCRAICDCLSINHFCFYLRNFIAIFLSFFITHALSMMFQFVMGLGWYWRKRRKNKRNQEFKVVDVKLEKKAGADGRQTYVIKRLKTNKPKASKAAVADKSGAKGEKSQAKGRKAGEGKPQAWLAEAGV